MSLNIARKVGHVLTAVSVPQVVILNDFIHRANRDIKDTRSLNTTTSKALEDFSAWLVLHVELETVLTTVGVLRIQGSVKSVSIDI